MKAKCPSCGGTGAHPHSDGGDRCWECRGHGEVEATLAEGTLYTLKCKECGFENGGRLVNETLPLPKDGPNIGCLACDADKSRVHYVRSG